jgi:hypothetical protein
LVRVLEINESDSDSPKHHTSHVMELPPRHVGPVRPVAPVQARVSERAANLVGLAIVLGSCGGSGSRSVSA